MVLFRVNHPYFFSGINSSFRHASKTEHYLTGKNINIEAILKGALSVLASEVVPSDLPPMFSPPYRKLLSLSLLYRMFLNINNGWVSSRVKSGGENLSRPISSGVQSFDTQKSEWPLTQPIPKLEALIQTAGEAEYINDIPVIPGEIYGCLVLATKLGDIVSIDPEPALKRKGVIAFYSAKDIPGKNNVVVPQWTLPPTTAFELFCSGKVQYVGQPVGVVIAECNDLAIEAARAVNIVYNNIRKPVLSTRDILTSQETNRITKQAEIKPTSAPGLNTKFKVVGEIELGGQHGYSMETQVCLSIPEEDGQLLVHSASQWMNMTVDGISVVTNTLVKKIDMKIRRLGGGFGVKLMGQLNNACASALAALKLNRPVKIANDMETDMKLLGKRAPVYVKYELGVDANGVIQYMNMDFYENFGCTVFIGYFLLVPVGLPNFYNSSRWTVNIYSTVTDLPPALSVRSQGYFESMGVIEQVMDHIAFEAGLDPTQVRINNSNDNIINNYILDWKQKTDFDSRKAEVDKFNEANRWKKQGLSLVGMKYPLIYIYRNIGVVVSICFPDGTVQVLHAGVEMGQGINTKVAVVCAHVLQVELDMVQVKPLYYHTFPNSAGTGGSVGSDLTAYYTQKSCEELNERLKPIREKNPNLSWAELIKTANQSGVSLISSSFVNGIPDKESQLQLYLIYGVTVTHTEVDVLTGERQILRVDLLEDVGQSLSPDVDVGQIEGGFVYGSGLYLSERCVYDKNTGALLNSDIRDYKIPTSHDIPIDFRISFIKNSTNTNGIFNSKATGEPATTMSVGVLNSLRNALLSARKDAGLNDWCQLDAPCTIEATLLASGTSAEQFSF